MVGSQLLGFSTPRGPILHWMSRHPHSAVRASSCCLLGFGKGLGVVCGAQPFPVGPINPPWTVLAAGYSTSPVSLNVTDAYNMANVLQSAQFKMISEMTSELQAELQRQQGSAFYLLHLSPCSGSLHTSSCISQLQLLSLFCPMHLFTSRLISTVRVTATPLSSSTAARQGFGSTSDTLRSPLISTLVRPTSL